MKKWKKMLGIFMSGAVLLTGGVLPQKNAVTAEGAADYGISSPRIKNGVTTWDKIKFGSYYQDVEAEPIKWRVLSVNGDDAFLLADKILDVKPYNVDRDSSTTWSMCSLRKWLNDNFYNEAFDDEEKKAVRETTVVNPECWWAPAFGGNTQDWVYLLSLEEATNASYGFGKNDWNSKETRVTKGTDYAKTKNEDEDGWYWWLRSPAKRDTIDADSCACLVHENGVCSDAGARVWYKHGVRPAMHINLSSSKVKDAGKVDSEGNVTMSDGKIHNPTQKNGVTTWDCVYFGNYRQSDIIVKQDIEWRVLSVDGDDAFLLADKILDAKPYNEEKEDVTWETCTLRNWLNEDFYNEAFTDEEKEIITKTLVINEDNPDRDTEGGNNTEDKVYLLSIAEVLRADYGFDAFELGEFKMWSSKTRGAKNTVYAEANGASSHSSSFAGMYDNGSWWLRSPGDNSSKVSVINYYGSGDTYGSDVNSGGMGVRPAMHINLSSGSWEKSGQVTAATQNSDNTPPDEPTESPEPTDEPATPPEPTKEPTPTDEPATPPEPTKEPTPTDGPATPSEPTPTDKPTVSQRPEQTTTPANTAQPTPPSVEQPDPVRTETPVLRQIKLSSVKCAKNTKKITGKVSVSKASVKVKVGKKAYKKAAVKGKKFTLKLNYKLKKKTKVIIKAEKKGYKSVVKPYTVK